jgi:hypothetical protein
MGHVGSVRALLELPLKHCPELLVLGLAQIKVFGLGGFNFFGGGIRYLHQSQYLFEAWTTFPVFFVPKGADGFYM